MYPKIFTHRDDPRSQVVIANAEQEAQLPVEYLPPVAAGRVVSAADRTADLMLTDEYAALAAEREKLEQDRRELEDQRAALTAGYKNAMAELDVERAAMAADQAKAAPKDTETEAAPAKRGRPAKEA